MDTSHLPRHDLFISYNQNADSDTSIRLQKSVKRIGLPIWSLKRRAVFRDIDGMHAVAEAQKRLIEELSASRYMALLACPESARSDWVQCELTAWLTDFKHTDWMPGKGTPFPGEDVEPLRIARLIICHTGGNLVRRATTHDFDWDQTDALPRHLEGVFAINPVWQDLTKRKANGTIDRNDLLIRSAAIAGAISDPQKSTAEIIASDRKLWIGVMSIAIAAAVALLLLGGIAGHQWRAAEKGRIAEEKAKEEAEREFQKAKKIVDDNFTQVAYELKHLPGAAALRLELMRKAQTYYTEFLQRRGGDKLDEDMAVALFNVGLIELELGMDSGPQFEEAVAFLEERAARNPGDVSLQRSWIQSLFNVGISALASERYEEAEHRISEAIATQARLRERFPEDRHLELDYWNAHLGLASAVGSQDVARARDSLKLFNEGKTGLEALIEKLANDPDTELRTVLSEMAEEHLAGALLNLANSKTLPLPERMRYAEESWMRWEELARQRPTDHQRFFQVTQACRLMAVIWNEFGDKGEAQVFAERSLLINRRLALNFIGNGVFEDELKRDLAFLQEIGVWKRDVLFHQAAVKTLEETFEMNLGDATQQRELAHRIALAHVQVASGMLRSYFAPGSDATPQAQREDARTHLEAAQNFNDLSLKDTRPEERSKSHIVMRLNIPMWLELTN